MLSEITYSSFTVWRALLNMKGNLVGLLLVSLICCHSFQNGLAEESSSASNVATGNNNILHRNRREAPLRYANCTFHYIFSFYRMRILTLTHRQVFLSWLQKCTMQLGGGSTVGKEL